MKIETKGCVDAQVIRLIGTLGRCVECRAGVTATLVVNCYGIHLRVVDPGYVRLSRSERYRTLWPCLAELPKDCLSRILLVVLLAPDEVATSASNREFESVDA